MLLLRVFLLGAVLATAATAAEECRSNKEKNFDAFYEVAEAVNTFGSHLLTEYRKKESNADSNVVFSPLSLTVAFFLLYKGAEGETRKELEKLFEFNDQDVEEALEKMPEELSGDSDAHLANRIYLDKSIELNPKYEKNIGEANIREVNFAKKSDDVRLNINKWVKKRTDGFIPDLIAEGLLSSETLFVLVNALYFKGSWKKPFKKEDTEMGTFHGIHGKEKVPFMKRTDFIMTYQEMPWLGGVMLSLPYKDSEFLLHIFLPDTEDGWKAAEKKFSREAGSVFDSGYVRQEVGTLRIPKWEAEATLDGLEKILSDLGISSVFSSNADFNGITNTASLPLSDVIHKARIVVDEEGTVAAAATVTISERSAVQYPPIDITVDRPFLYFIVRSADRTVFFQGTQTSIKGTSQMMRVDPI